MTNNNFSAAEALALAEAIIERWPHLHSAVSRALLQDDLQGDRLPCDAISRLNLVLCAMACTL